MRRARWIECARRGPHGRDLEFVISAASTEAAGSRAYGNLERRRRRGRPDNPRFVPVRSDRYRRDDGRHLRKGVLDRCGLLHRADPEVLCIRLDRRRQRKPGKPIRGMSSLFRGVPQAVSTRGRRQNRSLQARGLRSRSRMRRRSVPVPRSVENEERHVSRRLAFAGRRGYHRRAAGTR
jgi:hypothetical protein